MAEVECSGCNGSGQIHRGHDGRRIRCPECMGRGRVLRSMPTGLVALAIPNPGLLVRLVLIVELVSETFGPVSGMFRRRLLSGARLPSRSVCYGQACGP